MTMKQLNQYRRNMSALDDAKRYRDETTKNERMARLVIYAVALALAVLAVASIATAKERTPRYMRAVVTAYCPCKVCCGPNACGLTATGRDANTKGVAVDRALLGARIDVPGYGVWVRADDTGSAIKGNKLDIRMQSHSAAVAYGVRMLTVRVWE